MKFWPFGRKTETAVARVAPPVSRRRSYSAAGSKLTFNDFVGSRGSADYELIGGLAKVRERSRALARNSGTMKRYIALLKTNVVGPGGFRYRCRVRKGDKNLDLDLNRRVEWAYWRWCKRPTVDGKLTMRQLQNLMVASWARDGEMLIELVYNSRYRDGFALNPLEADMLDDTLNTVYRDTGNQIRMGVEVDNYGAAVAYHMFTQHPGDPGWFHEKSNKRYRRVSANRVIHVYEQLRPGQTRGEPPASAAILGVKMLDGYREAEVTARRIQASTMGFFKRSLPGAGQIDAMADRMVEGEEQPEFEVDLAPGTFKTMPDGYEFEKFESQGATTDYQQFEGQVKKDIAMGLNVSDMSLGMETSGVSYSTGRSVLQEDRDYYRTLQEFFIETFADVVIERWIMQHSLQSDSVIPPTRITSVMEYSSFAGRGWDWIDPAKDVKANAEALRTRQTSLSRIAAQRGIDLLDLIEEIANDEKILTAAGLTVTFDDGKSDVSAKEDPEDDGKVASSD